MKHGKLVPNAHMLAVLLVAILFSLAVVLLRMPGVPPILPAEVDMNQFIKMGAIVLSLLAVYDYLQLRQLLQTGNFTLTRHIPQTLPLHIWASVELEITHLLKHTITIELFDNYPTGFEIEHLPGKIELKPGQTSTLSYRIRPNKRGDAKFSSIEVAMTSSLKLWRMVRKIGNQTTVRIYPNFAAVRQYELLAIDNHTSNLGIKKKPRRGIGLEFHQLRDYRSGDTMQQIDWKATARRQKLISREYQDERDQQIFFMIDCGRRMRSQNDDLSHFDHSLNAILLVSYVALRQGDAVGLISFGGDRRWLPAKNSVSAINTILNAVYDLHPTTQASDYTAAAKKFVTKQRKRSLVVLVTNLREDHSDDLMPALQLLRQRHLVLLVSLREKILDEIMSEPITSFHDSLTYLGTHNYLDMRNDTIKRLQGMGIHCLDVYPDKLSANLVNAYLEIKLSNIL